MIAPLFNPALTGTTVTAAVMPTASLLKSDPSRPMVCPDFGFCLQPASKAMRTLLKVSESISICGCLSYNWQYISHRRLTGSIVCKASSLGLRKPHYRLRKDPIESHLTNRDCHTSELSSEVRRHSRRCKGLRRWMRHSESPTNMNQLWLSSCLRGKVSPIHYDSNQQYVHMRASWSLISFPSAALFCRHSLQSLNFWPAPVELYFLSLQVRSVSKVLKELGSDEFLEVESIHKEAQGEFEAACSPRARGEAVRNKKNAAWKCMTVNIQKCRG